MGIAKVVTTIVTQVDVTGGWSIDIEAIGGAYKSIGLVADGPTDNSKLAFLCHFKQTYTHESIVKVVSGIRQVTH